MASDLQLRKWIHPMLARLGLGRSSRKRDKVMTRRGGVLFRRLYLEALETRVTPSATLNWDPTHAHSTTGGGSGIWDTSTANWWNGVAGAADVAWTNGDVAVFGGNAGIVSLGTGVSASALQFNSSGYSITGNILSLAGGTGSINVSGGASATIGSIIAGNTGLQLNGGGGALTLTGSNTYTGATNIEIGTLTAANDLALGNNSAVIVAAGATLSAPSIDLTIGSLVGAGLVTMGSGQLTVGSDNTNTVFSGNISGNNAVTSLLVKVGSGTLTLAGNNTYGGGTTINGGTLQIGNGGSAGSLGTGPVIDNGSLAFNVFGNPTVTNAISGAGSLTQSAGTLTLVGSNSYTGTTTINGGQLQIGSGGTAGSLGTGPVFDNVSLAFNLSSNSTVTNAISGAGSLTQSGPGTLTLAGTNSYAGTTTINVGPLQIGSGGTTGSLGTGAVIDNSNLVFNLSSTPTVAKAISGSGSLTQSGSGTLTLSGANSYSSGTTISAGTLQLGAASALLGDVSDNGTLDLNGFSAVIGALGGNGTVTNSSASAVILSVGSTNDNGAFTGAIQNGSGAVALAKIGTGTEVLSGTNTYRGTTTISAGTLTAANDLALGNNSAVTVAAGATLNVAAGVAGTGLLGQYYKVTPNSANFNSLTALEMQLQGQPIALQALSSATGSNFDFGSGGSTSAPTTAGNYTVVASFVGSLDYAATSALANFTIEQINTKLTVKDAGGAYYGNPFPATITLKDITGAAVTSLEGVAPTLTYYSGTYTLDTVPSSGGSSDAPTTAGSYTVVASFAGSLDYAATSALANFTINQVNTKLTVKDAGGTYNGNPFPATVTLKDANGNVVTSLEGVAPTLTYYSGTYTLDTLPSSGGSSDAPTTAGNYTVVASFAGSLDYAATSALANFTIKKAKPTLTVKDTGGTANGNPFSATVTLKDPNGNVVNSLEGVTPTLIYFLGTYTLDTLPDSGGSTVAPTSPGDYTVVAYFAGSADFMATSALTHFTIK